MSDAAVHDDYPLDLLAELEAEAIYAFRETAAEFARPVLRYSIGKDSSVLLELAPRVRTRADSVPAAAHRPGFKFREMVEFCDIHIPKVAANLNVRRNREATAEAMRPIRRTRMNTSIYTKTKPLLEAIAEFGFDVAIGGARREEEEARARERAFSLRGSRGAWTPKKQRPNSDICTTRGSVRVSRCASFRCQTGSSRHLALRPTGQVDVVTLYSAEKRQVIKRHNVRLRLDEFVQPAAGETVVEMVCRYRTLGCSLSTGAVASSAQNVDEITDELLRSRVSERETRAIDQLCYRFNITCCTASPRRRSRATRSAACTCRDGRPLFTGVGNSYEPPEHPDLILPTVRLSEDEAVNVVLRLLADRNIVL